MKRIMMLKTGLSLLLALSFFVVTGQTHSSEIRGYLFSDGQPVAIKMERGKITEIRHLDAAAGVPDLYIAPGLIDIQINGYLGVDFSHPDLSADELRKAVRALWQQGVTTILPTVVPNDPARMIRSFSRLSELVADDVMGRSIPGFHLESPFISPVQGYRGAHLEKNIRPFDRNEFVALQTASGNRIKLITLAPELEGADAFIRQCRADGVTVSLGHHNGNAIQIRDAADAGASLSTHLGNGCANLIDRHQNPLWPQLANDQLSASLIVDGFHLTPEEVKCFYRMKGADKTILISDAVDLAGLPPGEYVRREKRLVLTPDNVVKFPDQNVLAGAASPLTTGIGNVMKFTGCSLADAIRMASENPARLLHLDDRGEIAPGKRADLILFTLNKNKLTIAKTILAGEEVYPAP